LNYHIQSQTAKRLQTCCISVRHRRLLLLSSLHSVAFICL